MSATIYYESDCDPAALSGKTIAVIGYGSQGHAHVLNLRDSGAKELATALREGSASAKKAAAEGVKVMSVAEAAIEQRAARRVQIFKL